MTDTMEQAEAAMRRWQEGTLSESEARTLEAWLEAHPEAATRLDVLADVAEFTAAHALGDISLGGPALPGEVLERIKAADFPLPTDETTAFALLDEAPHDGVPGRLGSFEIHGLLAAGGMGFVFEARDPALQRRVAIKVPAPHLSGDALARARFMAEAQAVAALDHPHIVPVLSVHEHGGTVFFVMPLVEGRTLAQQVAEDGPLTPAEAERVALHAARALAAAHTQGIVHRDIKPANLLMAADRVRVTDFGIAQPAGWQGAVSGTPAFQSPEQRAGAPVTPASDLWSLGATLNFALGDAAPQGKLTARLMSPEPAQRPSAVEVVRLLERQAAPVNWKRLATHAAVAAAVAALLGFTATRIPATADLLNRALLSPQRAFAVDGVFGAHATLADAVGAAPRDAVITIHHEGPWPLRGVTVPADRTLTIRAAKEVRPRFLIADTSAAGITSSGTLTLERLTFTRGSSADEAHGMIESIGGTLILRRCEIRAAGTPRRDAAFPCAILLEGNAALQVVRSALICSWAAPVALRGGGGNKTRVTLEHSALIGYPVVWIRGAEGSRVTLEAVSCSLPAPIIFGDAPGTPLPEVDATFTRCLLRAETALWWTPGETPGALNALLHWQGTDNLYAQGTPFLTSAPRAAIRETVPLAADLAAWQSFPGIRETNAVSADLPEARRAESAVRQRSITTLTHEELEALAAPWLGKFPDTGADFSTLWP